MCVCVCVCMCMYVCVCGGGASWEYAYHICREGVAPCYVDTTSEPDRFLRMELVHGGNVVSHLSDHLHVRAPRRRRLYNELQHHDQIRRMQRWTTITYGGCDGKFHNELRQRDG